MEVSSTMRCVPVIVLSLITLETDVKVCVYMSGMCGGTCVRVSKLTSPPMLTPTIDSLIVLVPVEQHHHGHRLIKLRLSLTVHNYMLLL